MTCRSLLRRIVEDFIDDVVPQLEEYEIEGIIGELKMHLPKSRWENLCNPNKIWRGYDIHEPA